MVKKEIGGYLEFSKYELPMLHNEAVALNCGRNCLKYLLRARRIKKILLPKLLCDSISEICKKENIVVNYYCININFLPENVNPKEDEWLYIVNYYGQLSNEQLEKYIYKHKRIIIDHAHAYFQMPIKQVDTLYTCRKFLGVSDGAFLYTNVELQEELDYDESHDHLHYLLARFERTGDEFYEEYLENEKMFYEKSIKRMSKLTENILHSLDYTKIKEIRTKNYAYLHNRLKKKNRLKLIIPTGAYMYPLYIPNGLQIRKKLQKEKIYIPILWPNVLKDCNRYDLEYKMACNILPLPIDQRYTEHEMDIVATHIEKFFLEEEDDFG